MYSDANNMRASADSRILRGYSINDIDMPTLHQYRRAYNIKHENHPWTEIDDKQFLENIGAYLKLGNSTNITTETPSGTTETTTKNPSVTTETSTITTEIPTDTTETIFKIISKNPKVTAKEIASVCGITEDGVAYHIKKLKQSGRIIRIGGSRNGGEWKAVE